MSSHPSAEADISVEAATQRRLVDAYEILSQLELSLREYIESSLRALHLEHWWKRGIPDDVRKGCEDRKSQKEKPFGETHQPLSYAYIHDYRKIVMRSDNWEGVFRTTFGNPIELEACFVWVGNVRDSVAHSRSISDDQYVMFVAGARWIQSRIRKKQ